jgi:hypothetical protein
MFESAYVGASLDFLDGENKTEPLELRAQAFTQPQHRVGNPARLPHHFVPFPLVGARFHPCFGRAASGFLGTGQQAADVAIGDAEILPDPFSEGRSAGHRDAPARVGETLAGLADSMTSTTPTSVNGAAPGAGGSSFVKTQEPSGFRSGLSER